MSPGHGVLLSVITSYIPKKVFAIVFSVFFFLNRDWLNPVACQGTVWSENIYF
jgi:hypothetical protein